MNYIIFDMEWNQPSDITAMVTEPLPVTGEIIEIGAVKLDDSFKIIGELRLYITPKYYTRMHKRIAALTGIRDKDLMTRGIPFPEAYEKFREFCGKEYGFMTWSMSDVPMLIDNMLLHGIDVSDLPVCYDIQRIFGREIMRSDTRYALDSALAILNEKGDTAHDALNDSRNTAIICSHLDLDEYLEEYGAQVFAGQPLRQVYSDHREALNDPALAEVTCPWCGGRLDMEPWIRGERCYMSCGTCPEEDEFLIQLAMTRLPSNTYRARRLMYEMSDDLWDIYMDRKEPLGV
ncbi:MAG: exonuclease domain-containing protein [Oscillospiraceae bacterium]|nr:exonuclease domain-containing protein [Oscillospiraceae bacterium]